MRNEPEYLDIHRQADRIEPRLARAVVKSMDTIQRRLHLEALTEAIEGGPSSVAALLDALDVEDALVPVARIVEDTVIKGAKLAEADVNEELNRG